MSNGTALFTVILPFDFRVKGWNTFYRTFGDGSGTTGTWENIYQTNVGGPYLPFPAVSFANLIPGAT